MSRFLASCERGHASAFLSAGEKLKHIRICILCWGCPFPVTPDNVEPLKMKKLPNGANGRILPRSTSLALNHSVLELGIPEILPHGCTDSSSTRAIHQWLHPCLFPPVLCAPAPQVDLRPSLQQNSQGSLAAEPSSILQEQHRDTAPLLCSVADKQHSLLRSHKSQCQAAFMV